MPSSLLWTNTLTGEINDVTHALDVKVNKEIGISDGAYQVYIDSYDANSNVINDVINTLNTNY